MEDLTYHAEVTIGGHFLFETTVGAVGVSDACAAALSKVGGARFQDPKHPVPMVQSGELERVGCIYVEPQVRDSRLVMREIIE